MCVCLGIAELQVKVLDLEEQSVNHVNSMLEKDAEIAKLKLALGVSAKEKTDLQLKVTDLVRKGEEIASRLTVRETDLEALQAKFVVEQTAHVKGKTTLSVRLKEVRGFLDAERKLHEDTRSELETERKLHADKHVLYEGACRELESQQCNVVAPQVNSSVEEREAIEQSRELLGRERAVFEHDQAVMEKERNNWIQTIELLRKQIAEYREESARKDSGVCPFHILFVYMWCVLYVVLMTVVFILFTVAIGVEGVSANVPVVAEGGVEPSTPKSKGSVVSVSATKVVPASVTKVVKLVKPNSSLSRGPRSKQGEGSG